ncbi:MAG: hypothetical protein A2W31_03715 [Planctomycetes bacterium RBG_16_64_10]|nr:MAG: hypothetical protein A2W31_03715 [Planctomycetes bacterium RBG_16_64_10]
MDLHFRVGGIPVRVHPYFWLVSLFLGMGADAEPVQTLIWVLAVFVSVLVHELGHALAARAHGWEPSITLYGFGGFAAYAPTDDRPRSKVLISAAGPAAGFAFALAVLLAIRLSGHAVGFARSTAPLDLRALGVDVVIRQSLFGFDVFFAPFAARPTNLLIVDLLAVNIAWGAINLLPVYPLDGGQIARALLVATYPSTGIRQSLWLSACTAAALVVYAFARGSFFMALLFGMLAYGSYVALDRSSAAQ